jgi:hypothetical protein
VANNDFELQNDFHEDRLSFSVYGEKVNLGHLRLAQKRPMKAIGKSLHHLKWKIIQLNFVFLNNESWVATVENLGRDPENKSIRDRNFFLGRDRFLNF